MDLSCFIRDLKTVVSIWPRNEYEAREITPQQFRWLLEGLSIEQPKTIKKSYPQVVL